MGMSIDMSVHKIDKMKEDLAKAVKLKPGQLEPAELLDKILPEFGIVQDGLFIVQTADYWDDYCPSYQFHRFIESYYQDGDLYSDINSSRVAWLYEGANAEEIASELNIELPAHPYDEEDEE